MLLNRLKKVKYEISMYEKKYRIESSDVDQHLNVKLSSLMRMMQDVATTHAEILEVGKESTIDRGMYWVITRYGVTILRAPKYLEIVNVITYPGDDMKFIFPRYFEIRSEKGELLVKASTTWMILDKNTHRVVMKPFGDSHLPGEHHEGEEPIPRKAIGDKVEFIEDRKVRYSDIDLNGHLNNTKYIEYVLDMKPTSFYKENHIKHIIINYEKELMGDMTLSLYSDNKNPEYIIGKSGNDIIFEINIEYDKK